MIGPAIKDEINPIMELIVIRLAEDFERAGIVNGCFSAQVVSGLVVGFDGILALAVLDANALVASSSVASYVPGEFPGQGRACINVSEIAHDAGAVTDYQRVARQHRKQPVQFLGVAEHDVSRPFGLVG